MEVLLLGVVLGVIAGLIPGVGVFTTLLLFYPIVYDFSIPDIFIFYIALVSTTQYIGSVSATILAVPGESSSLPAVYEGHALFKRGLGGLAISGAALGSLLGALIVLALVTLISPYFSNIAYFFNSFVQSIVISLIIILLVYTSHSSVFILILLAAFAWWLASIGCGQVDCYVPIDYVDFYTGLPTLSVVCALYIFPQLLKPSEKANTTDYIQQSFSFVFHIRYYFKNIISSIRGTVIGFFLGFTPGASMTLSSNSAYRLEVLNEKRKGTYKQGNYNSLVSAETANNAATLSNLLPLFLLGIPLGGSEVIFYDLVSSKGFVFYRDFTYEFFRDTIVYNLIIINLLAFLLAWPFAKYIKIFSLIPYNILRLFVFLLLCYTLYAIGGQYYQSEYYLLVFLALLPVGYLFRKQDMLPFIFVFILQDHLYHLGLTLYGHFNAFFF